MRIRLVMWLAACLALSLYFGELWTELPGWLSPERWQRYGVFHWGVLGLCILWLWLKRTAILPRMQAGGLNIPFILAGVAFLALSILLPRHDEFLVFMMLLGWLGIFSILFRRASMVPAVLLAVYGFSIAFPLMAIRWLGEPAAILTTKTVTAITGILGLPITNQGQLLQFTSRTGDAISTTVTPGCAGLATIGVFIALFTLMVLDIRLPLKKAGYIFLIGLAGTWLQNIIRILISLTAGYFWGGEALAMVHSNIAYVIFPLWFALFAYIYLRQTGKKPSGNSSP
ncbi:archaeosortase/exosortase family protein [Chloroflexota bacterium]